jgi:hypothetical protein
MKNYKPAFQVLESSEADFDEGTWTFLLSGDSYVTAGQFAIMPAEEFMKFSEKLARAEGLLRQVMDIEDSVGIGGRLHEAIQSHFDPEPL